MVFQIVSEPKGGRPKGGQGTGGHGKRQVGQEVVCDGPAEDVHARGPRGADGLPDLPSTVKKIVVEGWTLDVNIPPLRFRALVTRINRVIPSNRTAEQQPFLLSPFPALEYVAIDDPSVVPTCSPLRASAVRTVRICQMVFDPVALRQAFPPSCRTINVVFSAVSNYLAATRSAFCDPRFRWLCSSFDVLAFSDDYLPLTPHAGPSLHVTDAFGTAQLLRTVNKVLVAPEQMSFDLRTTALDRLDLTWFPSATTFSFELASEMTIDLPPNVEELHVLTDASVWFRGAAQSVAVTSERHVRLDFGDDDGVVVDLVEPADAVTVSMDWEATHTLAVQCASVSSGSVLPPQLHSLALSVPSLSPSLGVLRAIMVSQTQKNWTLLFLLLRDFWKLTMDYLVGKCKPSRNDKLNRLKTICVWLGKVGFETIFAMTWSEGEPCLRSVKAGLRHHDAGTSDTQRSTRSECKTETIGSVRMRHLQ